MKPREFAFSDTTDDLFRVILSLKNIKECEKFFRDVMTESELQAVSERFLVAKLLYTTDLSYRQINEQTGVSTATITRISQWMKAGMGGYGLLLKRNFESKKS